MNFITIIEFFACISVVIGLKCVNYSSDGPSNVDCNGSKYCYTVHANVTFSFGDEKFEIDQGCGNQLSADSMHAYGIKTCDEYGTGTQVINYSEPSGKVLGDLVCCDKDLCNFEKIDLLTTGVSSKSSSSTTTVIATTTSSATKYTFFGSSIFLAFTYFIFA
uniref:UPAR/Ly6 domain-containing protein n=1 Tax=Panagrolaimus davidi TaxID=227884 RepID=A0A914R9M6_9BILA